MPLHLRESSLTNHNSKHHSLTNHNKLSPPRFSNLQPIHSSLSQLRISASPWQFPISVSRLQHPASASRHKVSNGPLNRRSSPLRSHLSFRQANNPCLTKHRVLVIVRHLPLDNNKVHLIFWVRSQPSSPTDNKTWQHLLSRDSRGQLRNGSKQT